MKKIKAIFIGVSLILISFGLAGAQVVVSIPDTSSESGSFISIPIHVNDVTGKGISSVGITISYSQDVLSAQDVITAETIVQSWGPPTFNISPGHIVIAVAGTTFLSGEGPLFYIHFKVIGEPGDSTMIHFEDFLLNEGEPIAVAHDGVFTVEREPNPDSLKISIPDTTVKKYSWFDVPIQISGVTNNNTQSIGMIIGFNQNVLDSVKATTKNSIAEGWGEAVYNNNIAGQISIAMAGFNPLKSNGPLIHLQFYASGEVGDTTAVYFKKLPIINETSLTNITKGVVTITNPDTVEITMPNSATDYNSEIQLPIKVDDVNGKNITCINLSLHFNQDIIELIGFSMDSTISELWVDSTYYNNSNGILALKMQGDTMLSGEGDLLKLHFKTKQPNQVTNVQLIRVEFNSGCPVAVIDNSNTLIFTNVLAPQTDHVPISYQIFQNYPNPFNPTTTITFQMPKPSLVIIQIYNLKGQQIKTLLNEEYPTGNHTLTWDATDDLGFTVSSGVYILQMKSEEFEKSIKLSLLR